MPYAIVLGSIHQVENAVHFSASIFRLPSARQMLHSYPKIFSFLAAALLGLPVEFIFQLLNLSNAQHLTVKKFL